MFPVRDKVTTSFVHTRKGTISRARSRTPCKAYEIINNIPCMSIHFFVWYIRGTLIFIGKIPGHTHT